MTPDLDHRDPTDAPAPLRAALNRQGLLEDNEPIDVRTEPPPVRELLPPGHAIVEIAGRRITVKTTPPPPLRRRGPEVPSMVPKATADRLPPPPAEDRVPQDLARGPAWQAILVCALLVAGFAAVLVLG